MITYRIIFKNEETGKEKKVLQKAAGIIPAIEEAIRRHFELLGWTITKAEQIY